MKINNTNMTDSTLYPSLGLLAKNKRISEVGVFEFNDTHQFKDQFAWDIDLFRNNRRASEQLGSN